MKKISTFLLAITMVVSMSATTFATELPIGDNFANQTQGTIPQMSEEMLAELEALAEEAGMTLEEYLQTIEQNIVPEMGFEGELITEQPVTQLIATATSSIVYVDGVQTSFEAYNIDGNNYFKLRDLAAAVVSGSEKEFDVSWDGDLNAINLISGNSYTVVGGELVTGDGLSKTYSTTTSIIYVDGVEVSFIAYNIDGNNYFKLRDICSTFDIGVTWNSETSSIDVDTTISYIE